MKTRTAVLTLAACLAALGATEAGNGASNSPPGKDLPAEESPARQKRLTETQAEVARLRELRQENPDAFRQEMEQRRHRIRRNLEVLRDTDEDAYRRVMQRLQECRHRRLRRMHQSQPDRFTSEMGQRRQRIRQRLEELREQDPDRYRQIMERLRQFRGRAGRGMWQRRRGMRGGRRQAEERDR